MASTRPGSSLQIDAGGEGERDVGDAKRVPGHRLRRLGPVGPSPCEGCVQGAKAQEGLRVSPGVGSCWSSADMSSGRLSAGLSPSLRGLEPIMLRDFAGTKRAFAPPTAAPSIQVHVPPPPEHHRRRAARGGRGRAGALGLRLAEPGPATHLVELTPEETRRPSERSVAVFTALAGVVEILDRPGEPPMWSAARRSTTVWWGGPSSAAATPASSRPCAVEDGVELLEIARTVQARGAPSFGQGLQAAPRLSFPGLGARGLEHLKDVREAVGLGIVTEVLDPRTSRPCSTPPTWCRWAHGTWIPRSKGLGRSIARCSSSGASERRSRNS